MNRHFYTLLMAQFLTAFADNAVLFAAMLIGTGLYTLALGGGLDPVIAVSSLGLLVILATTIVAWHLPRTPEPINHAMEEQTP